MAVRLDPADEYMHELGPEPNFNESMYINIFDPSKHIGGFFRMGNRANEGTDELTVCIYLPNGKVAFMFKRPQITSNDALDAGGLTWTMVTPFEELRVQYDGKAVLLADPKQMADPKKAFTENPYVSCTADITFTGLGKPSMFGGEPDTPHEKPGEEFARGHYEQLIHGKGTITVGDETFEIEGDGLRDHSWGPRYWQAPWYYRWLTANVGSDFGFMASRVARRDGPGTRGGFVWADGRLHLCNFVEVSTTTEGEEAYHQSIKLMIRTVEGREFNVTGEVMNLIPLRNRRTGADGADYLTRISEGMTRWTVDGVGVGFGLSEYLDQIIDGLPVGIDE
jgi:hypothetical protein